MTPPSTRNLDRAYIFAVFGAALAVHLFCTTINWTRGFLSGHEFRQTQTALIAYYIDQENNFSVHYSTPILGKPWEIPLEFPLYEWSVVLLSRGTGWAHFISARSISLACFYLTLPAFFLLLGQMGMPPVRRLLMLALFLVTPVYIFYSRSFLIDPMAWMFSVWFLALFVQTMHTRQWRFLIACALCGTAGALIKSLVWFAWVLPAAIYGAILLGRVVKERNRHAVVRTFAWGLATIVVPVVALTWWVKMTDAIKEKHASAYIFTSANLSRDNYGTFTLASRLSQKVWRSFLDRWHEAIVAPWMMGAIVLVGLICFPRERLRVAAAAGLFILAQLVIPKAYADQDYYYYICAAFVVLAFGFVINGVMDLEWPRPVKWIIILVPFVAMGYAYRQSYFQQQKIESRGGTGLSKALRDLLPEKCILIVAGNDWASMIPYYSQHKALMIRNGLEWDNAYLTRAFADLKGEEVGALVLMGDTRKNTLLLDRVATTFGVDRAPAFTWADWGDIYINKAYSARVVNALRQASGFDAVTRAPVVVTEPLTTESLPPEAMASAFKIIRPVPTAYHFKFGYGTWDDENGEAMIIAHPDSDIWLPGPAGSKVIELSFGIRKEAFEREGQKTNGVSFEVDVQASDGSVRQLFLRELDPASVPGDRGTQTAQVPYKPSPGDQIVLRTRPRGDYSFDWAYWGKVTVK